MNDVKNNLEVGTSMALPTALERLRTWLAKRDLQAVLFQVSDRFQGETVQACDQFIHHLIGFAGSAGALLVTQSGGTLFVDGRYVIKGQEIANRWGLERKEFTQDAIVQALQTALGLSESSRWTANIDRVSHASLAAFMDKVPGFLSSGDADVNAWWPDRPHEHFTALRHASPGLASIKVAEKIKSLWQQIEAENSAVKTLLISDPAEVAWLLNLRGDDTPPLTTFRGRLVLQSCGKLLYFGAAQHQMSQAFKQLDVSVESYKEADLATYLQQQQDGQIWLCPYSTPYGVTEKSGVANERLYLAATPIQRQKARKDSGEIEGMRQAHLIDAVACIRFLHWLDENVPSGCVDEAVASERLWLFRAAEGARGVSFNTISAVGENAALPHYSSSSETNQRLTKDKIYLVDSGGQYDTGTTDITRTVFFGEPWSELVRQNTAVLMGHIDLARIRFPRGVTGHRLDTLARQHLWQAGLDFSHGTGHGVGAGLNVHEAPPTIAPRLGAAMTPFEPGMVVSNEPGYYEPGSHGIRIECLQVCQPDPVQDDWLCFEILTFVPIQAKLIAANMMSHDQLSWLNQFHAQVWEKTSVLFDKDQDKLVLEWLANACKPISKV